ncbi:MAG: ParB/RepB/Spo0J family partition protein [Acidobacteriota bacterium]|nr:ParB/RepB/Spo0J family partition protein [Blastocatellia bacterium]MDW8238354.1 ParB/RepB/Spo0J family partition protein [Acidobacteriota bacterium]
MTRRALGRGLSALLAEAQPREEQFIEVDIDSIDPSEYQPRTSFNTQKLEELAQSIRENGIVQPLLVRRNGFRYQLISGERRWRASQMAGLKRVPVVVRDIPDEKVLELSLIENIQRENLNPIEEAQAFQKLIDVLGITQEEVAKRVGRDRTSITNYVRLLKLPKDIQELVEQERLSMGHARAILGLMTLDLQRQLAHEVIAKGLSVRATEQAVQKLNNATKKVTNKKPKQQVTFDANVHAAVEKLRRKLNTQIRVFPTAKGGKLEIEFYSDEDFDRIYKILMQ